MKEVEVPDSTQALLLGAQHFEIHLRARVMAVHGFDATRAGHRVIGEHHRRDGQLHAVIGLPHGLAFTDDKIRMAAPALPLRHDAVRQIVHRPDAAAALSVIAGIVFYYGNVM